MPAKVERDALIKYEPAVIDPDEILAPGQKSSAEIRREKEEAAKRSVLMAASVITVLGSAFISMLQDKR